MRVLFVVAELQEAKPLIKHYKMTKHNNIKEIEVWSNSPDEDSLIVTGPGVNNIIHSLSRAMYYGFLNPVADVINVGYAGAKGIDVGEVVEVKTCHCFEFPTKADVGIENCVNLYDEGYDCYTSFDFVENADNIDGPALFDMEIAYIARFIFYNLSSIKIVSDNLSYDGFKSFDKEEVWKKAIEKIEKVIEERRGRKCFKEHYHIKQ